MWQIKIRAGEEGVVPGISAIKFLRPGRTSSSLIKIFFFKIYSQCVRHFCFLSAPAVKEHVFCGIAGGTLQYPHCIGNFEINQWRHLRTERVSSLTADAQMGGRYDSSRDVGRNKTQSAS